MPPLALSKMGGFSGGRRSFSMVPLVSILIPCFNPGPMLRPCLASCFAQTHPEIEIVLVDNNSTDGSPSLAEAMGRGQTHRIKIVSCEEQGQAFSRNRALEFAQGQYVQWLDSDDELSPEKIARQVAALESDPSRDIAYCDWEWRFIADGKITRAYQFPLRQYDDFLLSLLINRWVTPHAYLLRREVALRLRALGVWRPETRNAADREYFTLAALLGYRFRHVPDCRVFYNGWSTTQITRAQTPKDRARAYKDIFAWLRAIAEREKIATLTAEHRRLLEQDWGLRRADASRAKGMTNLDGPESVVSAALLRDPCGRAMEESAAVLAMMLWGDCLADAQSRARPPISALHRLRALLGMPAALPATDEQDAGSLPGPGYPFMASFFMAERQTILRLLAALATEGYLVRAEA